MEQITYSLDRDSQVFLICYGSQLLMKLALSQWASISPGPMTSRRIIVWDVVHTSHDLIYPMESWSLSPENGSHTVLHLQAHHFSEEMTVTISRLSPWHLTLSIETAHVPRFMRLAWLTADDESWQGFGEHTHSIRPPARFDSWVEEGPVGWGIFSRLLKKAPFVPFPKGPYPSYASLPLWLSSSGYSAWFTSFERIRWDLEPSRRLATIWASRTTLHIVAGRTPKEIFTRQFSVLNPPTAPPIWAFAPWNDSVQGQAHAQQLANFLRTHRIPSSAIWIEDWMGSQQNRRRFWMRPLKHRVDTTLYPQLPELANTLHEHGFRLLGYFCPEITEGTDLYRKALHDNLLVKDVHGHPLTINILGVRHGQIDVTHPKALSWVSQHLLAPALALGFDGWMADFGEYLPLAARLADGTTGSTSHNRYPLLWQELHRKFWDTSRPEGDWVFFVRSGWVSTHRLAPVVWGGDSDTDFEEPDGLPTVVPQALSAQTAGFFYWATDIAGYMTFGLTRPVTRLLFLRWLQVAALLPVMRTHHGTAAPRNWRFDKDLDTMSVYARYARLHTALYPYFYHLRRVASQSGLPLIRPLYLEYPEEDISWDLDREFLLGEDLLVAPVLTKRSTRHRVYLPKARWRSWWTGEIFQGPTWLIQDIPDDQLPLFIRHPSILPLLEGIPWQQQNGPSHTQNIRDGFPVMEGIVDSLAPITAGPGVDLHQALDYLSLYASLSDQPWQQQLMLPDTGWLNLWYQPSSHPRSSRCPAPGPHVSDHFPQGVSSGIIVPLGPGDSRQLPLANGIMTIAASADSRARQYIVRWW